MKGLALLLGAKPGKEKDDEEEAPTSERSESSEADSLFGDAFDALKDDDREGFIAAMKAGMRACSDEEG